MRDDDIALLKRILAPAHDAELTPGERDAFARMCADLECGEFGALSRKQRSWAEDVWRRIEPLPTVASGAIPRGREVPTPAVLQNLPMKPPRRAEGK